MARRRSQRYHTRRNSDGEFETPAFRIAAQPADSPQQPVVQPDDDLLSESGLGESPEEDLIEEQPSNDTVKGNHPESDDSDSAPEEVSLAKSRETEEKRQKLIKGELHKHRTEERERRRKRDELFKMQKKDKLAALNKRKLPEDLLEQLIQFPEKKQKIDPNKADPKEDKESQSSEEEEDGEEEEDFGSEEQKEGKADFLPLTDTSEEQVVVVSLKAHRGQGQGTQIGQSVTDFKSAMLYGERHKRVTSHEVRQHQAKRQARR